MARFFTLASGSSGNSTYLGSASRGILIDAGISCRAIGRALADHGMDFSQIEAVFVTHEHIDHIKGLLTLSKQRPHLPVYGSPGTIRYLADHGSVAPGSYLIPMTGAVEAAGMVITPFHTSHDCAEGYGFRIRTADDRLVGIATDLGRVDQPVREGLHGCELVMLESNYDYRMLMAGGYPVYLKRRVASDNGHLCNDDCAAFLPELSAAGTTRFVLCHLSQNNNLPSLAGGAASASLGRQGRIDGLDYQLYVAPRSTAGEMVVF